MRASIARLGLIVGLLVPLTSALGCDARLHPITGAPPVNAPCPTEYVGHYGSIPGFATFAATTVDGRRQVVIMLTNAPDTTHSNDDTPRRRRLIAPPVTRADPPETYPPDRRRPSTDHPG